MAQQLFLYVVAIVLGGAISLSLGFYAVFRLLNTPGGRYYMIATFLAAAFNFAYLFELTSPTLSHIQFWLKVEYLSLPFIPTFTLLMCCDYVGLKIRKWLYYLLIFVPMSTVFMQTTNDWHHWYYTSVTLRPDVPFPIAEIAHGPYFYVHFIFLYTCLAASVIILLSQLAKVQLRFRLQSLTMVAGLLAPTIASFFYVGDMSPYGIDLGPVFMSGSFIFHAIALFRYQMFNVAPIARDRVFESMKEGVLILGEDGRIVDYNEAVKTVIPDMNAGAIGRPAAELLRGREGLAAVIAEGKECDVEFLRGNDIGHYHILFSPVFSKRDLEVGRLVTFVDITERVVMERQLKYLATTDSLTRLLNKSALFGRSEELLSELARDGGEVSVLMFDIDHFKKINDTFGHEAGDQALVHLAAVIRESLGDLNIAGRYGGDEFIVVIPGAGGSQARELAEHIRIKVMEGGLQLQEQQVTMTSSFGISSTHIYKEDSGETMQRLVREADFALYEAKRRGKNCVCLYEQLM